MGSDKRKHDLEPENQSACDSTGSTSDSEEDSINSEDEIEANKEINVDFEACPILEQDLNGIKRMLTQLFLKDNINLNKLSETLLNQKEIGAIIRQINQEEDDDSDEEDTDEDDVLGLISFINLSDGNHSNAEWYGQLMEYFTKYLTGEKKSEIEKIIKGDAKKAWIINERFVNLGWQLAVPSFEQIFKELKASKVDFEYYMLICKILYPKRRYKEKKKSKQDKEDVIFLNPEEELLDECADYRYEFDVSNQCDSDTIGGDWDEGDQEYLPCRRVLIFCNQSWVKANENLKKHAANPTCSTNSAK
ncbi:protein BCCIP homolog [Tetranychus urticae]|uniref:Protein BCCIP homolog n=1 Tax=Tetranychus urticae TaxID=32264 RepID=T1KX42_TETUR|nr:protein BCCIP homolog [Tetranychus urticae]